MKIIHVFPVEKFTKPYIEFVNSVFDNKDHFFLIYGKYTEEKTGVENYENVRLFSRKKDLLNSKYVRKLLKDCHGVIIHGFNELATALVWKYPRIADKTAVVFWGGDIYMHQQVLDGTAEIKTRIIDFMKKKALKKIKIFLTFAHNDYNIAKKWFGIDGKCYDILYPSTINKEEVVSIYESKSHHEKINMILGNSATATNQHVEVMEKLRRYFDRDFNLFVPLSYGDDCYRQSVIIKGKELLGDNFIPVLDFMTPTEYSKFLSTMDIAIFNNNRQQATGNIELLAYFGAKVYLRDDTAMWTHYVDRDGRPFFNVDEIGKISFEELLNYTQDDFQNNHNYFSKVWDEDYLKMIWQKVFLNYEV